MKPMKIFNYKIIIDYKTDSFSSINFRPFLAGFVVVFVMTIMSYFGFHLPEYNFAIFSKQTNVNTIDVIKDKLKIDKHEYRLFKERPVVSRSYASSDFDNASSYISVNFENGKIISEKDQDKKLPIASLAKIMAALVALDLAEQSNLFDVSRRAANQTPTKIGVLEGQKLTLSELLNALLLTSANDAAEVIEEGIDNKYGKGTFVRAMNMKAEMLGLNNTHFTNPQGFDSKNNYSTASDLAVLSHFAITTYPLIAGIVKKDYQLLPADKNHNVFDLYNWNGLLGVYPGVTGLKIGNTDNAGYTTIVAAEREGQKILVVLLGAPGVLERDMWTAELLDAGFEKLGVSSANITEDQLQKKYNSWKYFN